MAIVWGPLCRAPDRCGRRTNKHVLGPCSRILADPSAEPNSSWGMCYSSRWLQTWSRKPTRVIRGFFISQLHFLTKDPRHFPDQKESFEQHPPTHDLVQEFFRYLGSFAAYWLQQWQDVRIVSSFVPSKPSEGSGSHATSAFPAYLKPRQHAAAAVTTLLIRSNNLAYVILTRQSIDCSCKNVRRRDGDPDERLMA